MLPKMLKLKPPGQPRLSSLITDCSILAGHGFLLVAAAGKRQGLTGASSSGNFLTCIQSKDTNK